MNVVATRCEAYLWVGDEPVPCRLAAAHKVQHSGVVTEGLGGTVRWSESRRRSAPRSVGPDEVRGLLKGYGERGSSGGSGPRAGPRPTTAPRPDMEAK